MKGSAQWHCSVCPKIFGRKGDLTRHKLLHSGIKRHICTVCNKAFSQYSGLKTHKNVHTKAKPFVCGFDSCSASFGDPSSCARHRKETHRRMAYRCPYPLCESSIKRRSAFTAHLKKHDIDATHVDIDAMAPPSLPVAVSVPKRESVQEITVIDIMHKRNFESRQGVNQSGQMYFNANEFTLHQFPHYQSSIPWTHYEDSGMADPSALSTLSTFPISNSFNYDNTDLESLLVMDSLPRPESPVNLMSPFSTRPKTPLATLPEELVVKTEDKMMLNVPRVFGSIQFSSMSQRSALCAYPFPHLPTYPVY